MSAEEQKYNPEHEELQQAHRAFSVRFLDEVLIPQIDEGSLTGKEQITPLYQAFQEVYQGQPGSDFTLNDVWRVAFARDLMFTNTQETIEVLEDVDYEVFETMAHEITVAEGLLWEICSEAKSSRESYD